jgi:hypothetical protein
MRKNRTSNPAYKTQLTFEKRTGFCFIYWSKQNNLCFQKLPLLIGFSRKNKQKGADLFEHLKFADFAA